MLRREFPLPFQGLLILFFAKRQKVMWLVFLQMKTLDSMVSSSCTRATIIGTSVNIIHVTHCKFKAPADAICSKWWEIIQFEVHRDFLHKLGNNQADNLLHYKPPILNIRCFVILQ